MGSQFNTALWGGGMPAGTGASLDNRSAFVKVIFCKAN